MPDLHERLESWGLAETDAATPGHARFDAAVARRRAVRRAQAATVTLAALLGAAALFGILADQVRTKPEPAPAPEIVEPPIEPAGASVRELMRANRDAEPDRLALPPTTAPASADGPTATPRGDR